MKYLAAALYKIEQDCQRFMLWERYIFPSSCGLKVKEQQREDGLLYVANLG